MKLLLVCFKLHCKVNAYMLMQSDTQINVLYGSRNLVSLQLYSFRDTKPCRTIEQLRLHLATESTRKRTW